MYALMFILGYQYYEMTKITNSSNQSHKSYRKYKSENISEVGSGTMEE
jgi:hypothetical protein